MWVTLMYVNKIHFFNIISVTKGGLMLCSEHVVEFLLLGFFLFFILIIYLK